MLKIKKLLLLALIIVIATSDGIIIFAKNDNREKRNAENEFLYNYNEDSIQIAAYIGNSREVIIPSVVDGKPVTSIFTGAFSDNDIVKKIKIPDSVTFIDSYAFSRCHNLKQINIPSGVTEIGISTFSNCENLMSIMLPEGITTIQREAFYNCASLQSINIPSSVTEIESSALSGTGISEVRIPKYVKHISAHAFANSKLNKVVIDGNVANLDYTWGAVFERCENLENVEYTNNTTWIDGGFFSNCPNLKSVVIPDSVEHISSLQEESIFSGCDNVTIYGVAGSYAETYAKEKGIAFKNSSGNTDGNPEIPDTSSTTLEIPSQPIEAAEFSLPGVVTNLLTGNEVRLSGKIQLKDIFITNTMDTTDIFDTEIGGIIWKSSNEDIISASDIKCVVTSENITYDSRELSVAMPVKKCEEVTVTITGTTRNGISASTKVEVFPKMTFSGYNVESSENIYRRVCMVTLDNPDKNFLEQFMPKLQLEHYIENEQDFISGSTRHITTRYIIQSGGKYAVFAAAFESIGIGSDDYAVKYHGCSEVLKTFSVQSNIHSWSDVRDKELSKMNEDQKQAYNEIQNAIGDFRDKVQSLIDSLQDDAEKKGGNALESSNKDLAKKLEEECGAEINLTAPVFEDKKRGEIRKKFIYTELSKKLASIANAKMGSIKVSDSDKAAKHIVDNVVRGYHYIDGIVQSEDKKMELSFNITGMYNAYIGSIWFTEASVVSRQMITVYMTQQHLENAMQQYAKDLAQLQSDAGDAIYSAMAKDLLGKSISDFAGNKFAESFRKYEPQLEKWGGVKGILDFAANCYTVYEKASAIDVGKIVNNTDIRSIAEELEKVKGLLDVEFKGFTNKAAKKAGKKVVKAAEYLFKICKDYAEDGKITKKHSIPDFFKHVFSCPVEVFVYDAGGNQIGYVGEDDLDYDSSIMIEEVGEAKVIYIPVGKEVSYRINGTGYGELNCSFEEYDQDGMAVGRLNYYDIDLTPESKIDAAVPSDGFVSSNSNLPFTVDGMSKAPDACLKSEHYEFVDIKVSVNDADGGVFRGAGKYVPGDAVNLVAVPNSGYVFAGWYDDRDNFVSMNRNIEFAARDSGNYIAKFSKQQGTVKGTVKSVKLSKTSYEYNGKARKPFVIAVDTEGKRISGKYYTVKYKNNKKVGKAAVTVRFKDGYEGMVVKTFTICPKKTSIKSLAAVSKGFTIKWERKTEQADGYQIQYSTGKQFEKKKTVTKIVKNASTDSMGVKKLQLRKKYYVRVRTYKTVNGKKYYSVWSKIKSVVMKK